jgi:hypothetical protein
MAMTQVQQPLQNQTSQGLGSASNLASFSGQGFGSTGNVSGFNSVLQPTAASGSIGGIHDFTGLGGGGSKPLGSTSSLSDSSHYGSATQSQSKLNKALDDWSDFQ